MENKVIVTAQNKNNLTDAIENYMEKESIDYQFVDINSIQIEKDITDIIYIGNISELEELDINNTRKKEEIITIPKLKKSIYFKMEFIEYLYNK